MKEIQEDEVLFEKPDKYPVTVAKRWVPGRVFDRFQLCKFVRVSDSQG